MFYLENAEDCSHLRYKELQGFARFPNYHHFTLRCDKSGIGPPSLRIKAPVKTDRARNAAMRTSKVFVQERIKTWRAKEAALSNVEKFRSGLRAAVSEVDFVKVTSLCERTAQKCLRSAKKVNLGPDWLVNLSKKDFPEAQKNVLSKGPHFAKAPASINPVDIAAPIESALLFSSAPQVVESTRIKICEAISRAKPPRTNVWKDEVLQDLELPVGLIISFWTRWRFNILKAASAKQVRKAPSFFSNTHTTPNAAILMKCCEQNASVKRLVVNFRSS